MLTNIMKGVVFRL